MRKNIIILLLCILLSFSLSGCFFHKAIPSDEATTDILELELTQKIELKGISYYIPADFQTMGKEDATILRHINTNDDNLLVGYLGDYDDSYMDTTEKHIELGSLAISSVKSSEGIDPDYDYTIISDLAVVKTTYTTKDTYNISYHFFANNGAYCMSYSSKEPISESNSKLLEKIVETVAPSVKATEALTTAKPTEVPTSEIVTEQPTTENEEVNQLVFEDDKVAVYYTGYEVEDDGDCRIHMRVVNKSNTDWEFVLMDTSINNYVIDPIFRVTVPSGKTANEDIFIFDTKLKDNNINNLETIEFKIHYFDTVNKIDEKESYTTTPIKIDL